MAALQILKYPDARLHTIAKPVEVFDDALRELVTAMAETMYEAPGIGLAATQVDVHQRVIVIDVSETKNQLKVFINPEILDSGGEKRVYEEGCLSVPGIYEEVERPASVRVRALDEHGKPFELQADGLLAVCLQHEIDHLNGVLFIDHMSSLKRNLIKNKIKKLARAGEW